MLGYLGKAYDLADTDSDRTAIARLIIGLLGGTSQTNTITLEELRCIRDDRKIIAIKNIRSRTNMGLKDAKDLADSFVNIK